MIRRVAALLFALSAAAAGSATAQDFASVPALAALPVLRGQPDSDSAMFVNDVNAPAAPAASSNGFGSGLPETRAADYSAPSLVAPQMDALPQPVPQNVAASGLTDATTPSVASDADTSATAASTGSNQPIPGVAVAAAAQTEARSADDSQSSPLAAAAAAEPTGVQPIAGAAVTAPTEDRTSSGSEARPLMAAAVGAPTTASDEQAPAPVVAAAMPAPDAATPAANEAAATAPQDTTSKATNFKGDEAATKESGDSGAHIATFFAVGAACALVVAGVAIARKRKTKQKHSKTPGTPKNELTFFHVQSRLTPPPV